MESYSDIFSYITQQETAFRKPIPLGNKRWSMKDHIERSQLYRDSDIVGEKTDFTPIKNITRPILNLQYRTEDIDVKDVDIYVDDKEKFHLSFLVKKYYEDVFTQEYDLDTYFDEQNQSRIDFGGTLSKDLGTGCPETVPLQSIAFCDQTDILSGPIGIKHYYSPDQLLAMADRGWGSKKNGATATLEDVIKLSREQKNPDKDQTVTDTPGRYIEIYEVHGNLPKKFADSKYDGEDYETRIFIVAFYQKQDSTERNGITLYTAIEEESPFDFLPRDPVFGRALGFGGAEELFDDQLWTNYDERIKLDMRISAAKTVVLSEDPTFTQKNNIKDMDNLEIADVEPGKRVYQMDTFPRNYQLFERSSQEKQEHANMMGAAQDPLQGVESASGTPFAAIQAQIQQGMGLHDYRRGKFAKYLEEIHKKRIIPHIQKKITQGTTFLSELSLDELKFVTDALVDNKVAEAQKEFVLNNGGDAMPPEMIDAYKQQVTDTFKKKGTKHFIEILKGEFKGVSLGVKVSIAGKSKNLGKATDAVVNILKFVMSSNSPALGFPGTWGLINQVIENAGLDPVDFSGLVDGFKKMFEQQQQAQAPQQLPAGQPQQAPQQMQPQMQ